MPSPRKLPPDDVLMQHVADNETNRQIGDRYGVSAEAVRQALVRAGVTRETNRPSHSRYLPWKIRTDHVGDVLARRLRSYSKRAQGRPLSDTEARLLEEWMKFMDGDNPAGVPLSVHYDRHDNDGFWLEPRRPYDRDYISPPDALVGV